VSVEVKLLNVLLVHFPFTVIPCSNTVRRQRQASYNNPQPRTLSCHTVSCCHVSSGSTAAGRGVADSVKLSVGLVFSVKIWQRHLCRQNCTILPH